MTEIILGQEARRRITPQEKIAIIQQSMEPGMSVSHVARLHGIQPSLLCYVGNYEQAKSLILFRMSVYTSLSIGITGKEYIMIQMSMTCDDDARRSGKAVLTVYGIGTYSVLSGREKFINNFNCSYITDYGSIPVGDYWIVKMPSSGFANTVLRELKDLVNHTNHNEWFGLFSAQTMSDSVFVNGVKRGQFRLHPLRPDGSGESWGCITFFKVSDFQQVRRALLRTQQCKVPGSRSGLMAYGKVSVKGVPDFAKCNV